MKHFHSNCDRNLHVHIKLPDFAVTNNPPKTSTSGNLKGKQKVKDGHQMMLTTSVEPKDESKSSSSGSGTTKKLDTKKLPNGAEDEDFTSDDESDDGRAGGQRMLPLLLEITRPCRRKGDTKKIVRCIGSKGE